MIIKEKKNTKKSSIANIYTHTQTHTHKTIVNYQEN